LKIPKSKGVQAALIVGLLGLLGVIILILPWQHIWEPLLKPKRFKFTKETISVLILPFAPLENCIAKDEDMAKAVALNLAQIIDSQSLLEFEVFYESKGTCPLNYKEGRAVGRQYNADIVVWGIHWERCGPESTEACVMFVITDPNAFVERHHGKSETRKTRPDYVYQGELLNDVHFVIHYLISQYFYSKGDLDNAAEYLKEAIKTSENWHKSMAYALFQLAEVYREQSKFNNAIEYYEKVINLDEGFMRAFVNQGLSYEKIGSKDIAKKKYQEVIQSHPATSEEFNTRGSAYSNLGRYKEALQDFSKSILLDSNFVRALINRAVVMTRFGRYDEAINDITKSIKLSPSDARAHGIRAQILAFQGQFHDALAGVNKSLSLNPYDPEVLEGRAQIYMQMKKFHEALQDCDDAISLAPKSVMVYLIRSQIYIHLQQFPNAMADCNTALKLNPNKGLTYGFRGSLYLREAAYEQALADFDSALSIGLDATVEEVNAYTERAAVLLELGRFDEAIKSCDKALNRHPEFPLALYNKAAAFALLGNSDTAMELLKKATLNGLQNYLTAEIIRNDSVFVSLRQDPRFSKWLKESWQ